MSERREERRIDVCLNAVWDGSMGNYSARVTDLSENGCYIDSLGEALEGEVVTFRVQLPDGEWLDFAGTVAHHNSPFGFGLRFVDLTAAQRERLLELITHLKSSQDGLRAKIK